MASPNATILRGGIELIIPAREVVPSDILFLKTGDKVLADARLIEVVNLQIDEASLTGESVPVDKTAALRVRTIMLKLCELPLSTNAQVVWG